MLKNRVGESRGQNHLADPEIYQFLEKVDLDLAEIVREAGCVFCFGTLHRAFYKRKPRGVDVWPKDEEPRRCSFCCDQKDCRRRHTPPSVRFIGRRVYAGLVVVLVSAMVHGLKPNRVEALREKLGIDRRTLERWRQWWVVIFVDSSFWKEARARFMPPLDHNTLPLPLCEAFEIERRDRLLDLLKFLSPLTTPAAWKELVN